MTVKGEEITCKARLLYTLADLPAKASLTNMMQFNGKFGCPTCNRKENRYVREMSIHSIHQELMRAQGLKECPWSLRGAHDTSTASLCIDHLAHV